ncbi:Centromere protein S [Lachnellula suecica]|uniref:Centromere protein S n=1 Tax=Lachnellula suecica TaxID=602035 RepID=A0A8T9BRK2_9HELO|nr:Centromere protein S [Lachnellula suecica]
MADGMDDELRERLKASLWFSIGKIVDEETQRLNTTATPQFIGALTEMVWTQIGTFTFLKSSSPVANKGAENVAQDLESFSRHAGRTTVTTDDVLLITRRNDALHGIMEDFVEKEQAKAKGKGKTAAKGKAVKGKSKK